MTTRNDRLYLYDIAECCRKIEIYLVGVAEADFKNNLMLQDAIVRNIEIIGEAAKSLTEEIRANNPQVEWREIMRMRDKIVHHYFRLNLEIVWQTAMQDIPKLKPEIEKLLDSFPIEQ
jgi:uncharacterized protein with HEPN domain